MTDTAILTIDAQGALVALAAGDTLTFGRVDDAAAAPVGPQALRERQHCGLGGAVGDLGRSRRVPEAGGHVDDVAVAPLEHGRAERQAAVDHAVEVDPPDPPPVVDGHVGQPAGQAHARVVDQDVGRCLLYTSPSPRD